MIRKGSHAVVLGGGFAGLLCARMLTEHFEQVTIIERDVPPAGAQERRGAPQGAHAHAFWWRGLSYCDQLLPGLRDELIKEGAVAGDTAASANWFQFDGLKLRAPVGIPSTGMTRPFFERQLRRRVSALPSVQILHGTTVIALEPTEDHAAISAVLVKQPDGSPATLPSDLVIDASGRPGLVARWLPSFGYEAPEESNLWLEVQCATRLFRRTGTPSTLAHIAWSTPPGKRAGICFAVEGDRWQMTLIASAGEPVPVDDASFLAFAGSLPLPDLQHIASTEEPLGELQRLKFPFSVRRHYERLDRFPDGLLVVGDALACFNPVYGQGMTTAALVIEALAELLTRRQGARGISRAFFARAAAIIDAPWQLAAVEDLRHPEAEGERSLRLRLRQGYGMRVHRAAAVDPIVARAFFEVAGLQRPPRHLLKPAVLWRALGSSGRARRSA